MKFILTNLKNKKLNRKRLIFSLLLGINFSLSFVFGKQLNEKSDISFSVFVLFSLLILIALFTAAFYKILGIYIEPKKQKSFKIKRLKIFLPFFAISLLILLAAYPGVFCYDSVFQYHSFHVNQYTTHYPMLFCFIYGAVLDFGNMIFGNYNAGQAIFVFLQAIIIDLIITEIIYYCSNSLKSKKYFIISFLFLLFHPLLQVLILSSCQDVLFGGLFALLTLELLKMSENKSYFDTKKNYLKVAVIVVLMCLFRNNGFFACIPMAILGIIVMKKQRKQFCAIILTPLLLFQIINITVVKKIASTNESIYHESLNVPLVQIARALYYRWDKVYDEDLHKFFKEDCNWIRYEQMTALSDDYKKCMKDDYLSAHIIDFMKMWAKIGTKAPVQYIEAPGILALGLYYPWTNYPNDAHRNSNQYHPYIDYDASVESYYDQYHKDGGVTMLYRSSKIPRLNELLRIITQEQVWSKIPIFRLFWCGAFTTIMSIIAISYVILRKQYKLLLPLGLIFGLILTIFLAPGILFRYLFPVVLTVPIMIYIIMKCLNVKGSAQ